MSLHYMHATGSQLAWGGEFAWETANDPDSFRFVRKIQAGFQFDEAGKGW